MGADNLVVYGQFSQQWQRPLDGEVDDISDVGNAAQSIYDVVFALQINATGIFLKQHILENYLNCFIGTILTISLSAV